MIECSHIFVHTPTLGDVLSPTASPSKVKENIPTAQPTKSSHLLSFLRWLLVRDQTCVMQTNVL